VLVIDKPRGPTSHDVVAHVRRTFGIRKVGHTGTLDPLATGVLPLVLGRATRLARFLSGGSKRYVATVRFGLATDTFDAAGQPLSARPGQLGSGRSWWSGSRMATPLEDASTDLPVERARLERALERFRGTFLQRPPAYSAKQVEGERAYVKARQAAPLELAEVPVTITGLDVVEHDGTRVCLDIECSAGFYVRSLAHDLGLVMGCGAHLEALRRTASGEFTESQALALDAVATRGATAVIPCRAILLAMPAVRLTPGALGKIAHGQSIGMDEVEGVPDGGSARPEWHWEGSWRRMLDESGDLVALGRADAVRGLLQPAVVLI
jgi:tRNA pseudouridine55 synthase